MTETFFLVLLGANTAFLLYLVGDRIFEGLDERAARKVHHEERERIAEGRRRRAVQRKDNVAEGEEGRICLRVPPVEYWPVTWSVKEHHDSNLRLTRSRAFHTSFRGLVETGLGNNWKQAEVVVDIATSWPSTPDDDMEAGTAAVGYGQHAVDEATSFMELNLKLTLAQWAELLSLGVGDQDTDSGGDALALLPMGQSRPEDDSEWMAYLDIRGYAKASEGVYFFLVERAAFGTAHAAFVG